jgi:hypothetical protein
MSTGSIITTRRVYEIRDIIGRYYFEVLIGLVSTDNNQSAQRREKETKASTMTPASATIILHSRLCRGALAIPKVLTPMNVYSIKLPKMCSFKEYAFLANKSIVECKTTS